MNYTVNLVWDDEAAVWIATSEDIPGLVLESGSFDALCRTGVDCAESFRCSRNVDFPFSA